MPNDRCPRCGEAPVDAVLRLRICPNRHRWNAGPRLPPAPIALSRIPDYRAEPPFALRRATQAHLIR